MAVIKFKSPLESIQLVGVMMEAIVILLLFLISWPLSSLLILHLEGKQSFYILSPGQDLDSVELTSTMPFVAIVGHWANASGPGNQFEMIPPTHYYAKVYVLPLPQGATHTLLKVFRIMPNAVKVKVAVTQYLKTTWPVVRGMELNNTFPYEFLIVRSITLVNATEPVMAIQYVMADPAQSDKAMVIAPPMSRWVWRVVIFRLEPSEGSTGRQAAYIVIKTTHVSGLKLFDLTRSKDMTQELQGMRDGTRRRFDMTVIVIPLSERIYLVQHNGNQPFLALQYGFNEWGTPAKQRLFYAFNPQMNISGLETTTPRRGPGQTTTNQIPHYWRSGEMQSTRSSNWWPLSLLCVAYIFVVLTVVAVVSNTKKMMGQEAEETSEGYEVTADWSLEETTPTDQAPVEYGSVSVVQSTLELGKSVDSYI